LLPEDVCLTAIDRECARYVVDTRDCHKVTYAYRVGSTSGGGFLLHYCDEERQCAVADALRASGLAHMQFGFSSHSVWIAVNDPGLSIHRSST
jgi:hypothetical protein